MAYLNNRPTQLERIRLETTNKLYARQPVLVRKLTMLMNKSEIIQNMTEPSNEISKTEPKEQVSVANRKELMKTLNKFSNEKQPVINNSKIKKITDIRKDVLFGLK